MYLTKRFKILLCVIMFVYNFKIAACASNSFDNNAPDVSKVITMAADISDIKNMLHNIVKKSDEKQDCTQIGSELDSIKESIISAHIKLIDIEERVQSLFEIENKLDQSISKLDLFQLRMEAFEKSIAELTKAFKNQPKTDTESVVRIADGFVEIGQRLDRLQNVTECKVAYTPNVIIEKDVILQTIRNEFAITNKKIDSVANSSDVKAILDSVASLPSIDVNNTSCCSHIDQHESTNDVTEISNHLITSLMQLPGRLKLCTLKMFDYRYCTDDGGVIIQSRRSNQVSFAQGWESYKRGFGNFQSGDFWMGIEAIHELTYYGWNKLKIEIGFFNNTRKWGLYDFEVDRENTGYLSRISKKGGNLTHDFIPPDLSLVKFYTADSNEQWIEKSCGRQHNSGWWFSNCTHANLNGKYYNFPDRKWDGIHLDYTDQNEENLKDTKMILYLNWP